MRPLFIFFSSLFFTPFSLSWILFFFSFLCLFFKFCFSFFVFLHSAPEFTCFLRSRCSMEMWCPDDIGRDSWDWVGPPAWGRACFNSPEWGGGSSPVQTEPHQIVLLLLLCLCFGLFWCVLVCFGVFWLIDWLVGWLVG